MKCLLKVDANNSFRCRGEKDNRLHPYGEDGSHFLIFPTREGDLILKCTVCGNEYLWELYANN